VFTDEQAWIEIGLVTAEEGKALAAAGSGAV
jgi:hypothetical protein